MQDCVVGMSEQGKYVWELEEEIKELQIDIDRLDEKRLALLNQIHQLRKRQNDVGA